MYLLNEGICDLFLSYVCFSRLKAFILCECGVLFIGKLTASLSPFLFEIAKTKPCGIWLCLFREIKFRRKLLRIMNKYCVNFKAVIFCPPGQWWFQCQLYRKIFRILLDFLASVAVSTTVWNRSDLRSLQS